MSYKYYEKRNPTLVNSAAEKSLIEVHFLYCSRLFNHRFPSLLPLSNQHFTNYTIFFPYILSTS